MQTDIMYVEAAEAACRRSESIKRLEGIDIIFGSVSGSQDYKDASYATVVSGRLTGSEEAKRCSRVLSKVIRELAGKSSRRILVAGLGNPKIPADSLGSRVAELIMPRFNENEAVFALTTGDPVRLPLPLSTAEVVAMFASRLNADLIIAVDALAARIPERMNAMIQVTDAGISPGSGANGSSDDSRDDTSEQSRGIRGMDGICRICRETMGVDVLSIGVPTVIRSQIFSEDKDAGARESEPMLLSALNVERETSLFAAAVAGGINLFAAGL